MMRIALVMHSLGQGGTDRVAVHLANGLARDGAACLVMAAPGGSGSDALGDRIAPCVERCVLRSRRSKRTLDLLLAFPAWLAWLRRERPDIVLATGNNIAWFAAAGFALRGHRHGRLFIKTTNPIVRPHDRWLHGWFRRIGYGCAFRLASGVLTLSEGETRRLAAQFPKMAAKFRAVRNPYVTPEMLAAGKEKSQRGGPQQVLAIGRLDRQKNFDLLLRAWARADRGEARLQIVGDGPDRAALVALADHLGIANSVTFAGYQADVIPWLRGADLFVLSSRYEGLPAVVIEAMALDCPTVVTDCFDAARELLGDAPGCALVPVGDETALAAAISSALAARSTPSGLRALAERYSIDASVESHCAAMGIPAGAGR